MPATAFIAASLLRFLDPFTSVYQTDDPAAGASLSAEAGYWPVPQGLVDPCAGWEKWEPRIVHAVFRVGDGPLEGYDPEKPSPLFKVNQVGYLPQFPKYAYIGAWLGPKLGPWKPRSPMEPWRLVDADTGDVALRSDAPPLPRMPDATAKDGVPFTGEETYEMDFSAVTREGRYFLLVPGVGRSETFRIAASAAEDAFRVHMLGLYQKRCGIAKAEPFTHWTAGACHATAVRGTFAPEEGKLEPKVRWFDIIRHNTDWENGERIALAGGWHDAADYDRRPMHLNIVNDLCAVYLMRPDNFPDGQLSIPENANGIPDILDEAEWGLRHLLAGQQPDGGVGTWVETTAHPEPGNVAEKDEMRYALSRATRRSSLMYAAHAAMLARCHPVFRERYVESAKRAWAFALREKPQSDFFEIKRRHLRFFTQTDLVEWEESPGLPMNYLAKAAINLHALTGDTAYLDEATARERALLDAVKRDAWNWPPLLFSGEIALGVPDALDAFAAQWKGRIRKSADELCRQLETSYPYRAPWWPPSDGKARNMSWGQCHPLRRAQALVAAHGMTGEERYIAAASLANDFHDGCNPQGSTLTSGLGTVYPVTFLDLPSYVDGIAEYVPGITPYRWTTKIPPKAVEFAWGGDAAKAEKWPIWRRWENFENQTVAASEYTVWETIAPAASVTGYLTVPSGAPPPPRPPPAKDIRDLPGYWRLP